jgi:hypothetical protein
MAGVVPQDTIDLVKVFLESARALPPPHQNVVQINYLVTFIQEKTANMSPSDFFAYASSLTGILCPDHTIDLAVAKAVMDGCIKQRESASAPDPPEPVNAAQPVATPAQPAQVVPNSSLYRGSSLGSGLADEGPGRQGMMFRMMMTLDQSSMMGKQAMAQHAMTQQAFLAHSQQEMSDVARIPVGPQEDQTPTSAGFNSGKKRQRTIDNAATAVATEDIGELNPNNAPLSPFTALLKKAMPRKAVAVVAAQLNGTKAEWTHNAPAPDPASSKMRKSADRIEKLLQVESGGDERTAATILSVALSHRSMKGVGNLLQAQLERSTDRQIVDSISTFLTHHDAKGRRSKETQNAVDAVLVAATFGSSCDSANALAERLGKRTEVISSCIKRGQDVKLQKITFAPSATKQRSDCHRLQSTKAVRAFCHSDEGGRDNTDSKRVYKVEDPEDKTLIRECPSRLWRDIGWANKHKRFLSSSMYKQFQEENPGKTIQITVFRESACICIQDPTA